MYYYPKLKELRIDRKNTQSDIAKLLHTTQQQYYKYEKGIQEIPVHHLITLSLYYEVSIDYIVNK